MRFVLSHPEAARKKGQAAQRAIAKRFSRPAVTALLQAELARCRELSQKTGVQAFRRSGIQADGDGRALSNPATAGLAAGLNARTPERLNASPSVGPSLNARTPERLNAPSPWPLLLTLAAVSAFRGLSMGMSLPFFNVFFEERFHAPAAVIGTIFFGSQVVSLPSALVSSRLPHRYGVIPSLVVLRIVMTLALGVMGAAWATNLSRVYMAGVLLIAIVLNDGRTGGGLLSGSRGAVTRKRLRRLVNLGLPAALQLTLEVGVFAGASALAGKLTPVALASHQVALNVASFVFMIPLGMASASAALIPSKANTSSVSPGATAKSSSRAAPPSNRSRLQFVTCFSHSKKPQSEVYSCVLKASGESSVHSAR